MDQSCKEYIFKAFTRGGLYINTMDEHSLNDNDDDNADTTNVATVCDDTSSNYYRCNPPKL